MQYINLYAILHTDIINNDYQGETVCLRNTDLQVECHTIIVHEFKEQIHVLTLLMINQHSLTSQHHREIKPFNHCDSF